MAKSAEISFLRDLRYRLEYLGLRFLIGLVRLVPLDLGGAISAKAGAFSAPRNRRHKRALANLERAFPDKTPEEREQIALAAWENLGRVMVETMNIDRILKEPDRLHVTNGHWITRYKDKMGPVLIVTMHMGNWELGMWPVTLAGVRPAGVYRQVKNPYVDRYLRAQRKDLYPGGLFGRGRARRPGRDAEDRAADHGLCAPGRPARLHLRSLRRARHRGAVLRLSRQEHADRGHDRAAGRRAHLDRPLHPDRQPRLFRRQCQRAQDSAHQQSGRGHPLDHRGDPAPFRDLDPRDARAIHVVEPALVLISAPTAVDSTLELRSYREKDSGNWVRRCLPSAAPNFRSARWCATGSIRFVA